MEQINNILFIRHGEPDYKGYLHSANAAGLEIPISSVGLSLRGIMQSKEVCSQVSKFSPDIIISSPYTRALQTAVIISNQICAPVAVEKGLVEWMANLSIQLDGKEAYQSLLDEFSIYRGVFSPECKYKWESIVEVRQRAVQTLNLYAKRYKNIAVVTHKMLIFQLTGESLPFCGSYITSTHKIEENNAKIF